MSRARGVTIDDIIENQLPDNIFDPVLARFVSELTNVAEWFRECHAAKNWEENYKALLEICHILQQIRLEYGDLGQLDRLSRTRIVEIVQDVAKCFGNGPKFTSYLAYFAAGQQRAWARKAVQNILARHNEAKRKRRSIRSSGPR